MSFQIGSFLGGVSMQQSLKLILGGIQLTGPAGMKVLVKQPRWR